MTNNNPRYVTPTGIANYPWLVEPDTKFNPDGDYRVTMIFNEHTPELDYILQDLQKVLDNSFLYGYCGNDYRVVEVTYVDGSIATYCITGETYANLMK